jgi:hypothetical protein
MAAWVRKKRRGTTGVPWWKPILAAGNGSSVMHCDRVVPFFDQYDAKLCRMLTDRGTEFCGTSQAHEYQLHLPVEDIDHSRTKARSPQTNGDLRALPKKPSCRSSTRWRSANASITGIEQLQTDLEPGSPGTTNSDHIRDAGATARRQCKPFLTPSHSPRRNPWPPPDVGQTQPFRHQTDQLSDQVSVSTLAIGRRSPYDAGRPSITPIPPEAQVSPRPE